MRALSIDVRGCCGYTTLLYNVTHTLARTHIQCHDHTHTYTHARTKTYRESTPADDTAGKGEGGGTPYFEDMQTDPSAHPHRRDKNNYDRIIII